MKMNKYCLPFIALAVLSACAVEEETPANRDEKAYFDAWVHVNHPDAEYYGFGIYIIEDEQVTDGEKVASSGYVFADYTITDLDGNVTSTSDYGTAKKVGGSLYDESYYYGPTVLTMGDGYQYRGVTDLLSDMTIGGRRKAVIPGWLLSYVAYDNADGYIQNITGNSHAIYEMKPTEQTDDITQWEFDKMKEIDEEWFELGDSTEYGFYYKALVEGIGEVEDLHKDTTVYINYTGRLYTGKVFDTTIADTAKVHKIYDPTKTYEPVSISMNSDMSEITKGDDESSTVTGFAKTLWYMKAMEKGVGMFYSGLGYGYNGSGSSIPGYAPLVFEIQLVEEPE